MTKNSNATVAQDMEFIAFLEQVARRLKEQYLKDRGTEFLFGTFRFVFHKGRFQGLEEWPRNKKYLNPSRDTEQED